MSRRKRRLLFEHLERRELLAGVDLPHFQTFDDLPTIEQGWEHQSTNDGRISIVNGRLRMDDSTRGGYSHNKSILHLDLEGKSRVKLTGNHWEVNNSDETHTQDGIFISSDGDSWHKTSFVPWSTTRNIDLDLDAEAKKAGIEYTSDFQIMFSQYDNYPANADGREWDNIRVWAVAPPVAQTVSINQSYAQYFTSELPGGDRGWEYNSTNDGRIQVVNGRLRMDDSTRGGYSHNYATLNIDLDVQGSEEAVLTVQHWSIKDELHDKDGVFISSDGITWEKIDVSPKISVVLPNDTQYVKLSQYDNYPASSDGREWDNVYIEVVDRSLPIDWPAELGYWKDLFIDGGAHISSKGTYAANFLGLSYDKLFTSSTSYQNSIMVSSSTDSNGALLYPDGQIRYRMYYMNGGSSGDHVASLGKAGKQRVQDFFYGGGSYTGSCAGAFAAGSKYSRYYQLIPNTNFDRSMPWGTSVTSTFDAASDKPFSDVMKSLGFGTTVYSIPTYGGPVYRPGLDSIVGTTQVPGLQYFGKNIKNGYGAPQVAAYQAQGTGRMAILSGHPEYRSSGSNLGLMATVYQYAINGAKAIPDLKDKLQTDQTVQMDTTTTKLGDKQYHRYTIDVQAGQSILDIDLTKLGANADLYVQYDSPANSQSYLYKSTQAGTANERVVIDNPQAGTWHVSVFGNHTVKNGAAYTLMA